MKRGAARRAMWVKGLVDGNQAIKIDTTGFAGRIILTLKTAGS
jgi:hypothetical protein